MTSTKAHLVERTSKDGTPTWSFGVLDQAAKDGDGGSQQLIDTW